MTPTARDDERSKTPAEGDDERDVYLSEALRHAPDSALGPPPALSDAILREAARSASAAIPRKRLPSPASWPGAVWAWLARPAVAAGFASLVAATLVGMMWWDRPLDETLPRPQAVGRAPSLNAGQSEAGKDVRSKAPPSTPTPTPGRTGNAETVRSTGTATREESSPQELRRAPPQADGDERRPSAGPPQAFPAPERPLRSDAPGGPPRDAGASTEGRGNDTRERSLSKQPEENSLAGQGRRQAKARADAAAPAATAQDGARPTVLADVRRAIADAPGRWSWQRDREPPRPVGAGLQRWLGEVDAAMARAPVATGEARGHAGVGGGEAALEVRLLRSGQPRAILRLDASGVSLEIADEPGTDRLAALGPDESAALKARLAELER